MANKLMFLRALLAGATSIAFVAAAGLASGAARAEDITIGLAMKTQPNCAGSSTKRS